MITVQQLKDAIEQEFDDDEPEFWYCTSNKEGYTLKALGIPAVAVDHHGGEGQGDEYWYVAKIGEQYFMRTAYYSSWDGVYWGEGDITEVEPYEVTVTRYREK